MTSPIQLGKTYGVLHTESFFSFLGFAKKIGSDETQKIDVFLDDKLIDTIEANEFIQKIDDMYDVESKAFTYNLPIQYIGKKAIISFKNHDSGEELLNSPYTLIDKNHEKFNEAKFLHSLSEPIDEEKIKDIYCPNSIGFLATKENLEDEEFMGYIKELINRFPDVEFKGFCFDNKNKDLFEETFPLILNIKSLQIDDIYKLLSEIEIYIFNWNSKKDIKLIKLQIIIRTYSNKIMVQQFDSTTRYDKICDFDNRHKHHFYIQNYEYYGFSEQELIYSKGKLSQLWYGVALLKISEEVAKFDNIKTLNDLMYAKHIGYAIHNTSYKNHFINIEKQYFSSENITR
ncbi:hypothetical protein [Aliarcobacter cryaerophilus]|uniref:hypothetical protein n=1 Tax=Aliarcobacter cryaerophilus TaxID=28198 RepID=UPI0021B61602|nr:hypothetical protein [Aliarcobacter cryaerophilus]MCT7516364.1 hypothetical protein [Aliarcobacter cryaerophilus]